MDVNECYIDLLENRDRFVVLKGSAGSGKSHFAAQKMLYRMRQQPGFKGLAMRKIKEDCKNTVFNELKSAVKYAGLDDYFEFGLSPLSVRMPTTGSEIIFLGADDPEKLKGVGGVDCIWLDEVTSFDEEDVKQLDLRMRGETDYYYQFILTFNPVSEQHWVKRKFFDENTPSCTTRHTTYRDNPKNGPEYVATMEHYERTDPAYARAYCYGNWGKTSTDADFYKGFDDQKNVRKCDYDPELPIWLSLDFNVVPHCTGVVYQCEGNTARQIDELIMKAPRNTTEAMCHEFLARYGEHQGGVFVTGDASGESKDTRSGGSDYDIVRRILSPIGAVIRPHRSNPSVNMRGRWLNQVFSGGSHIIFEVDPKCVKTIEDLTYVREAADGTKLKQKVRDKQTGQTYEKYGHCSDCVDYAMTSIFPTEFEAFKRGPVVQDSMQFGLRLRLRRLHRRHRQRLPPARRRDLPLHVGVGRLAALLRQEEPVAVHLHVHLQGQRGPCDCHRLQRDRLQLGAIRRAVREVRRRRSGAV